MENKRTENQELIEKQNIPESMSDKINTLEQKETKNTDILFLPETICQPLQTIPTQSIPEEITLLKKYIDELLPQEDLVFKSLLELKHQLKEQGVKRPEDNEQVKDLEAAFNEITSRKLLALSNLHNKTRNVMADREKTSNRRLKRLAARRKYGTTGDDR